MKTIYEFEEELIECIGQETLDELDLDLHAFRRWLVVRERNKLVETRGKWMQRRERSRLQMAAADHVLTSKIDTLFAIYTFLEKDELLNKLIDEEQNK